MDTQDWNERAERRTEWQDQFTMCGNFQWHQRGQECDCSEAEQKTADEYAAKHHER